jgi:chromosome segregation ATPase
MRLTSADDERTPLLLALAPLLAVVLSLGACAGKDMGSRSETARQALDERNQILTEENARLTQQLQAAETADAEAAATIAEVQAGLEEIRGQELKILKRTLDVTREGQARVSTREILADELGTIRTAIRQNLDKLARLQKEQRASGQKVASLQKLADELKRSLEEKDATIATLEKTVVELDEKVRTQEGFLLAKDTLIQEKDGVIEARTKEINTAFVAVAGKKVLKEKGVVEKKGSILGLGGAWQETGRYDPEVFREIDTTLEAQLAIPAPAEKVKILPGHPEESYRIVSGGPNMSTLQVTDHGAFWRDSRYLVVMIPD